MLFSLKAFGCISGYSSSSRVSVPEKSCSEKSEDGRWLKAPKRMVLQRLQRVLGMSDNSLGWKLSFYMLPRSQLFLGKNYAEVTVSSVNPPTGSPECLVSLGLILLR